jgi:glycosyltransferase involved in cell wall biosynthesis
VAPVAFVVKGYPRLSETFIAQEIAALEARGLDILIVSLRQPTDGAIHPVHRAVRARVHYLPEYLYRAPVRVTRALVAARARPGFRAALTAWLRDLARDPTPNRVRRFGQAAVLAAELPANIAQLHAHFIHTPASVTRYAALLRGLPWSVSAHAKDIWTTPAWEKTEKLASCAWAVTCSAAAFTHLAALAPGKVTLAYHGLDAARFPPFVRSRQAAPTTILSVGRAVEKKGFDVLIDALALLPPDLGWRLVHIGGGALLRKLKRQAAARGIADRIEWRGAQPQERVLAAYRDADLFVLACRQTRGGDRDGLPNVLLEAQSQGLPCITTTASAAGELIDDTTGILVPPADPAALARAIEELLRDPPRRSAFGRAGETRVRNQFAADRGIDQLCVLFGVIEQQAAAAQ